MGALSFGISEIIKVSGIEFRQELLINVPLYFMLQLYSNTNISFKNSC